MSGQPYEQKSNPRAGWPTWVGALAGDSPEPRPRAHLLIRQQPMRASRSRDHQQFSPDPSRCGGRPRFRASSPLRCRAPALVGQVASPPLSPLLHCGRSEHPGHDLSETSLPPLIRGSSSPPEKVTGLERGNCLFAIWGPIELMPSSTESANIVGAISDWLERSGANSHLDDRRATYRWHPGRYRRLVRRIDSVESQTYLLDFRRRRAAISARCRLQAIDAVSEGLWD